MALRPEYSLGHSKFGDFLFAYIGEEKSGMQLTVLSALARLGFDPWEEAARLSQLTKEAATGALVTAIGALPEGRWTSSDLRSIAVRLVSRLPKHATPTAALAQAGGFGDPLASSEARKWLIWIALAAALIISWSGLNGQ